METHGLEATAGGVPASAEAARDTNAGGEARQTGRGATSGAALACRRMADTDIEAAIELLGRGFPERDAAYWRRALERLKRRTVPDGHPRYGYVMTDRGRIVGLVLLIFAKTDQGAMRGNVSSWYVEPSYRGLSHMLLSSALRLKETTLVNISPAPTTHQTIAAQGFTRYVNGTFLAVAAFARPVRGAMVKPVAACSGEDRILSDHAGWGCLSFEVTVGSEVYPFVFVRLHVLGGRLPCAQLAYCRDVADFVRFAGPLGRRLLRHGLALIAVDADGALEGVPGVFRAGRGPKFYRGATPPRLGDLSYTELAIFGP